MKQFFYFILMSQKILKEITITMEELNEIELNEIHQLFTSCFPLMSLPSTSHGRHSRGIDDF